MPPTVMAPLALAIAAAFVPLFGIGVSRLVGIPFLDGFYFGALLAGYLWFHRQVHSPIRVLALVAVSGPLLLFVISSTMTLSAIEYILPFLKQGPGPGVVPFMLAGGFGALVLGGLFLALATRTVPPADLLVCAAAGAGLGAFGRLLIADGLLVQRLQVSAGFLPLFIVWQSGMAFVLAFLVEPARQQIKSATLSYSTVAVALVALMLSWMGGYHLEAKSLGLRQPTAQVIERPPSTGNLPVLRERPLDETFIGQIGQLSLQGEGSVDREREQLIARSSRSPAHTSRGFRARSIRTFRSFSVNRHADPRLQ